MNNLKTKHQNIFDELDNKLSKEGNKMMADKQ
jgi:hypothetical protein